MVWVVINHSVGKTSISVTANLAQYQVSQIAFTWINDSLQADDKPPAPPAAESIHIPITEPTREAQPAREFNTAVAGSFDIGAAGVEDVNFDHWWLETRSQRIILPLCLQM